VPEFREGKGQLAALEDRLQRRVEGRLGEALQVWCVVKKDAISHCAVSLKF
jgi:hypothetical protein